MDLLKLIRTFLILWIIVIECFTMDLGRNEEKVMCEISEKTTQNLDEMQNKFAMNMRTMQCNLVDSIGFYYNSFHENVFGSYNFYDNYNQSIDIELNFFAFKDNSSRLFFYEVAFKNGEWQLMPSGLDSIFRKVNSLNVTNSGLSILDKKNFKNFGVHLAGVNFSNNLLTFLKVDLFQYNTNLRHCDLSSNPFKHIPSFYFRNHNVLKNQTIFYFDDVECIDSKWNSWGEFLYSSQSPINCTNSEFLINYDDLESRLNNQKRQSEIFCDYYYAYCENSENTEISYDCNMTVKNIQINVVKKRQFFLDLVNKKCTETAIIKNESIALSINFSESNLYYLPKGFYNIFENKIRDLNVYNCGLKSINEFDMKQFGEHITAAYFTNNNLRVIRRNTFIHNKNLGFVALMGNRILFVDINFSMMLMKNNGNPILCSNTECVVKLLFLNKIILKENLFFDFLHNLVSWIQYCTWTIV